MTSPLNHDATTAFFAEHAFFGLPESDVRFFQQGVMPSMDKASGRVLLKSPGEVATNPDGHGGAFRALYRSGAVADMKSRGVEHLSYFQVDNPNVHAVDPVFLGLHAEHPDSSGEMSSKMIPKVSPGEKVGVFCLAGGKTAVIEYSDLPDELAEARDDRGELRFIAGSIAIHALSVGFIERVATDPAFELPFHRAVKKVAYTDLETGKPVEPETPNAVKLEQFVFDAIPLAGRSLVVETDRVEEFAPVKNREGTDSIETSKRLQTERAARWLEGAGVRVPRSEDTEARVDADIEISPLTALFGSDLIGRDDLPQIEPGARVAL
jgi:UDP-N-acetylglucosamine/UDP-N-acetylgalactosamine diphosphorylase